MMPVLALLTGLLHPVGLGLALVTLGYAVTLWTYTVMGNSWRMGVNAREKTPWSATARSSGSATRSTCCKS
jgi:hypothetical protein